MRLIDADAENSKLLDFIAEHDTGIRYALEQKDMTILEDILFDYFEAQKIAYDVDKVVEQLETKILGKVCIGCGYLEDNVCTYKGANCGVSKPMYEDIKKVFEEAKAGGVNE